MSEREHIAGDTFEWRGHKISIQTDGLGRWPWYVPGWTGELDTWETMVFAYGGPERTHHMQWRYLSREGARAGHTKAVAMVHAYLAAVDAAIRTIEHAGGKWRQSDDERRAFAAAAQLLEREGLDTADIFAPLGDTADDAARLVDASKQAHI